MKLNSKKEKMIADDLKRENKYTVEESKASKELDSLIFKVMGDGKNDMYGSLERLFKIETRLDDLRASAEYYGSITLDEDDYMPVEEKYKDTYEDAYVDDIISELNQLRKTKLMFDAMTTEVNNIQGWLLDISKGETFPILFSTINELRSINTEMETIALSTEKDKFKSYSLREKGNMLEKLHKDSGNKTLETLKFIGDDFTEKTRKTITVNNRAVEYIDDVVKGMGKIVADIEANIERNNNYRF